MFLGCVALPISASPTLRPGAAAETARQIVPRAVLKFTVLGVTFHYLFKYLDELPARPIGLGLGHPP